MRIRSVLIFTALVSSILGAVVVYLILTVPNDLKADALLKQARNHIQAGENDRARTALSRIVQQYPRTDAAAAATVALVKLGDEDRQKLTEQLAAMQRERASQTVQLAAIRAKVEEIAATPAMPAAAAAVPPQPTMVPVPAAAPAVDAAPKPAAKKRSRRRSTHRRRHR